jgi:RNA polymerase sigma-70 factor (ECF subfamily)
LDAKDTEEFAALWIAAQGRVAAFVRTLVPDFDQADEVLQRVAVALVRNFDRYDRTRPFGAWAIGVAKYEVFYHRRQKATDKHVFGEDLLEQVADRFESLAMDQWGPFRAALNQCLEELDPRARHLVDLRYGRGLKSPAISEKLHLSSGAVRMMLLRARSALRHCIEHRIGKLDSVLGGA